MNTRLCPPLLEILKSTTGLAVAYLASSIAARPNMAAIAGMMRENPRNFIVVVWLLLFELEARGSSIQLSKQALSESPQITLAKFDRFVINVKTKLCELDKVLCFFLGQENDDLPCVAAGAICPIKNLHRLVIS